MLQSERNQVRPTSEGRFLCNFAFGTENYVNLIKAKIYDRDSSQ
jgi:hypothetical protein